MLILAFLSLTVSSRGQSSFVQLAGEARIPIPPGWLLATDSLSFPFQLIHESESGEILIFKSEIDSDEMITNQTELKASVDDIVDEIILKLPASQLLSSTGFYEVFRAGFVLDFNSLDSATAEPLRHRLKCIMYRHPDNYQIMFTIWVKCKTEVYPDLAAGILAVQDQFVYSGAHMDEVFGSENGFFWPLAMVALFAAGMLVYLRRAAQRKAIITESCSQVLWECECGQRNLGHLSNCPRCGNSHQHHHVS